jgi:hypothetical protein
MNTTKYNSRAETTSISTIVHQCNSKQITLNPPYQRGLVWSDKEKQGYIDSIFRGIVPNSVIINIEDDGKIVCIDGKQRLTTLVDFCKNRFCFEYRDDNDNSCYIYYDQITDPNHQDNADYRTLSRSPTNNERSYFDNRSFPVTKYEGLSYTDQIDIFNRIQNGKQLVSSEIILSVFANDKLANTYKEFCEKFTESIKKYIKKDKQRSGNVGLLTNLVYLLINQSVCQGKGKRGEFIRRLNTMPKLTKVIDQVTPTLELYFSADFLNKSVFNKKRLSCMSDAMLQQTILICQKNKPISAANVLQLRTTVIEALDEYINTYTLQKKKKKNESAYNNILELKLKEIKSPAKKPNAKKSKQLVEKDDTDDSTTDYSSEEIEPSKRPKKRMAKSYVTYE